MKQIEMTMKEKDGRYTIKHNRKTFAKIYPCRDGFAVEKNGIQWTKKTFNDAIDQVKELAENMLSCFNCEAEIIIR